MSSMGVCKQWMLSRQRLPSRDCEWSWQCSSHNVSDTFNRRLGTRVHGSHPYSCESIVLCIESHIWTDSGSPLVNSNILNLEKTANKYPAFYRTQSLFATVRLWSTYWDRECQSTRSHSVERSILTSSSDVQKERGLKLVTLTSISYWS